MYFYSFQQVRTGKTIFGKKKERESYNNERLTIRKKKISFLFFSSLSSYGIYLFVFNTSLFLFPCTLLSILTKEINLYHNKTNSKQAP